HHHPPPPPPRPSPSLFVSRRGFGFVTFADPASVDKVLAQPHHELDSKTIDPKVAFPRRAQPKMVTRTKKIFVGGLSANTVVEDVKQYFEQFGKAPWQKSLDLDRLISLNQSQQ
uniref:Uncharacterized protein n=1 Tax=Serinus canaria TaxID=9135 RepID=A0A8C9UF23_SERCA